MSSARTSSGADSKNLLPDQVLQENGLCSDNRVAVHSEKTLKTYKASQPSPAKIKGTNTKSSSSSFSPKTSSPRPILPKVTISTATILPFVGPRVEMRDAVCGPSSPRQISAQIQTDIQDPAPRLQRLVKEGVSKGSQAGETMVGDLLVTYPERHVAVTNMSTQVSAGLRSWGNLQISNTGTQVSVNMVSNGTQVTRKEACILPSRKMVQVESTGTQASLTLVSNGVQINFNPIMTAVAVQTAEDENINMGAETTSTVSIGKNVSGPDSAAGQLPVHSYSLPKFLNSASTSSSSAVQVSLPVILLAGAGTSTNSIDTNKAFDSTSTTGMQTSVCFLPPQKHCKVMAQTQTNSESNTNSLPEPSHVFGQALRNGRKMSTQSCKRRILTSAETQTRGAHPDKKLKRGTSNTTVGSLDSPYFEESDMQNLMWNLDLPSTGAEETTPSDAFPELVTIASQTKFSPGQDANIPSPDTQTSRISNKMFSSCVDGDQSEKTLKPYILTGSNTDPLLSTSFLNLSGFSDSTQTMSMPLASEEESDLLPVAVTTSMMGNGTLNNLQTASLKDSERDSFSLAQKSSSIECASCDEPHTDLNNFDDLLASSPPSQNLTTDTGMQVDYDSLIPNCTSELGVQTQDDFLLACTSDFGVQTQDSFLDVCTADLGVQTGSCELDCLLGDLSADLPFESLGYSSIFSADTDIQTVQSSVESVASSTDATFVDCGIGTHMTVADIHTQTNHQLSPGLISYRGAAGCSLAVDTLLAGTHAQTSQPSSVNFKADAGVTDNVDAINTKTFCGTINLPSLYQLSPDSSPQQCSTLGNQVSINEFSEDDSLSPGHSHRALMLPAVPNIMKVDRASILATDMHTQTADDLLDFLMTNMETQTTEEDIFERSFGLADIQTQTVMTDPLFQQTAEAGSLAPFGGASLITTETQTCDQITTEDDNSQFFSQFTDMQTQTSFNILDVCEGPDNLISLHSQTSQNVSITD